MSAVILRLTYKTVKPKGSRRVEVRSLSGAETFDVRVYEVSLDSLIVQNPHSTDPMRYKGPLRLLPYPWEQYCKWHSGPLDSKDKPWERIYCNMRANGYCKQHRRTDRYLYDMCMSLKGDRALEACKILDRRVKAEYVVYLLDSGGSRPKVGTTRAFRLYERISEQRHLVATVLAVYDRAVDARKTEMRISSLGFATEHQRSVKRRSKLDRSQAILRVSETARKVSKVIGQEWDGKLFWIEPETTLPPVINVEKAMGSEFYPVGYWGGLLILKGHEEMFSVEERPLLHRLSLEIPKGREDIWRISLKI